MVGFSEVSQNGKQCWIIVGKSWERPGSDVAMGVKPQTSVRGPEDPVGSWPPLASGCLHLSHKTPFIMLFQQMCFLQIKADSLMTHVKSVGVGWRGQEAFGRFVGPFPGYSHIGLLAGIRSSLVQLPSPFFRMN